MPRLAWQGMWRKLAVARSTEVFTLSSYSQPCHCRLKLSARGSTLAGSFSSATTANRSLGWEQRYRDVAAERSCGTANALQRG